MKKLLIAMGLLACSNTFAFAITGAQIYSYNSMPKNTMFEPKAVFRYGIRNDTKFNQVYTVRYSLCADGKDCVTGVRTLPFAPAGSMDDGVELSMPITYYNSGNYHISAYIDVIGESNSHYESHSTINIY